MTPDVNEHGVFTTPTETIKHTTPSGAWLRIELVQCDDGWREGVSYHGQWCGGGYAPSVRRTARESRQNAIDFAAGLLCRAFDTPGWHEISSKEASQRDEVYAWCNNTLRQQELFA